MTPEENKAFATRWFELGLGGDFESWVSMTHDDFRFWRGARWHSRDSGTTTIDADT